MEKDFQSEGAAEYQLRNRLQDLLLKIEDFRSLPDHLRSSPAPKHVLTGEPLAGNMRDYHQRRVLDAIRSSCKILKKWKTAVLRPDDPAFNRLHEDLGYALGCMFVTFHPAQATDIWRNGVIPQKRHLSDPPPEAPPMPKAPPATPKLNKLGHDVDRIAYGLLAAGMPLTQALMHPELINAKLALKIGHKSAVRHERERQVSVPTHMTREEHKCVKHAWEMAPQRYEEWANAETAVVRFVDYLTKNKPAEAKLDVNGLTESDEPEESGKNNSPPLTANDRLVLKTLAKFDPTCLCGGRKIEDAMPSAERLSQRTILPIVKKLVELGFAERPEGNRAGARLTLAGRRVTQKIAD